MMQSNGTYSHGMCTILGSKSNLEMKSVGEECVGSMQILCCFTKRTGASADFGLCGGCWNQSSTNTEGWLDRNAQKRMSKKEREKNNEKGVNIWK